MFIILYYIGRWPETSSCDASKPQMSETALGVSIRLTRFSNDPKTSNKSDIEINLIILNGNYNYSGIIVVL